MAVIEPQFQRDFISLLPKVSQHLRQPSKLLADPGVVQELALYVLSYLEPRDLLRAAQTCRYWRVLAEDNLLWREKCREVPPALHCTAPHCTALLRRGCGTVATASGGAAKSVPVLSTRPGSPALCASTTLR